MHVPQIIRISCKYFWPIVLRSAIGIIMSVCLSVRPSVCLQQSLLWLDDSSYSKSVWTSE